MGARARRVGSSSLYFSRKASNEQRSPWWPSSTPGMSYGIAPSRSATCRTWSLGTNRNVGSRSMNRLISHGHAMRSTRAFSRVTHFIDVLLSVYRVLLLAVGLVERRLQSPGERGHLVGRPEM